jgi:hypothetical protein
MVLNQFGKEIIRNVIEDIYVSTNSENPFISVAPAYNENGTQDTEYCKILHRDVGELTVKGDYTILGELLIEEKEIRGNKTMGYGKN